MARAHSAVVAGPEVLNFNTLSAHLAGLDAEVLWRHNLALSTPVNKRHEALRAQSAGALESARWHSRTASSGESAPLPLRMAA
jgi:hypothetical protein